MEYYTQIKNGLLKKYELLYVIELWLKGKYQESKTTEEKEHITVVFQLLEISKTKTLDELQNITKKIIELQVGKDHPPPQYDKRIFKN